MSSMKLLLLVLARLPLPLLYATSYLAYVWAFLLTGWRRDVATRNIANAFPAMPEAERQRILRTSYRNLADVLAETIWGYGARPAQLSRRVIFENPEALSDITSRGQSVVLLAAHLCNWEWLLLAAAARFNVPIDAVYKPQRNTGVDEFLRKARSRFGGNPIPHRSFVFEVMRRKSETRAYALVADQTPVKSEEKHWTHFLEQDTAFYVGADKIAKILKVPVLYVAMRRVRRGHYTVRMERLADPPYEHDGAEIVERYARVLEREIRAQPCDWLWIHRKWKYRKPAYA